MNLPILDAHTHLAQRPAQELQRAGAVLAMTASLDESALAICRKDDHIAWGVGCHPRIPKAQGSFNAKQFEELAKQAAIVGEIGPDFG